MTRPKTLDLTLLCVVWGLTDKLLLLQDQPTVIIKLKQALEDGQITPDELSKKYPSVAAEYFANVD